MLTRKRRNWNLHILLVGMGNGTATLENILAFSLKIKHKLNVLPSNSTSRYRLQNK